jgi:hypothetical protein
MGDRRTHATIIQNQVVSSVRIVGEYTAGIFHWDETNRPIPRIETSFPWSSGSHEKTVRGQGVLIERCQHGTVRA